MTMTQELVETEKNQAMLEHDLVRECMTKQTACIHGPRGPWRAKHIHTIQQSGARARAMFNIRVLFFCSLLVCTIETVVLKLEFRERESLLVELEKNERSL